MGQTFHNHMEIEDKPRVTKASKSKEYTEIQFKPDLSLFGYSSLDDDMISIMHRRVIDVAGIINEGVRVYWNGERVNVKGFEDYVELFIVGRNNEISSRKRWTVRLKRKKELIIAFWENWYFRQIPGGNMLWSQHVLKAFSQLLYSNQMTILQMSFVNGICTSRGGKHLTYLTDQLVSHLQPLLEKRLKRSVKPLLIRQHLSVFCNCLIENPTFDTQTKDFLTTSVKVTLTCSSHVQEFGSTPHLSDSFLQKIMRSGLPELVAASMKIKDEESLRKGSGVKASRILGIPKLDDANNAGTRRSNETTLIVTEGDSAKALAVGGLGTVGRDNYGVFPLKVGMKRMPQDQGKVLNVKDVSEKASLENEEIQNLVRILGLKYGKEQETTDSLRYGHLLTMTDQVRQSVDCEIGL